MIKVLGASGSLDKDKSCISFQLNHKAIIDAGNVIRSLGDDSFHIEQVFLTHAHFDHILDLPFLIETYFDKRSTPLKIYALKATLNALETHIFNDIVWPKFQDIQHPEHHCPLLEFHEIQLGEEIQSETLTITPVPANHVDGACGYLVKENGISCLISGDTYLNPELTRIINADETIKSLVIDTSFPSHCDALAKSSHHLTPTLLKQMLDEVNRPLFVYPYHLKPAYFSEILKEFTHPDFKGLVTKVLEEGDQIDILNQKIDAPFAFKKNCDATNQQLQSLLMTAQALSSETDVDKLLEMILTEAMDFSQADAGTLYRLADNGKALEFTVVKNRSLHIHMGGTSDPITWNSLPLYLEDGSNNQEMVATYCALYKKIVNISSVYDDADFNFEGTKQFDASTGYHSQSMLVIPLLNANQELLGVLQLINKTDENSQNMAFTEADQQNTSALASQAAISLTNSLLIKELEILFESFISTITKAFDEKCSFTGGHVQLVAELSNIIAQGIDQDEQFYKDVHYNADDLNEIRLAALLHDVGKISTPEFIMQKSSKLEKIVDRIDWVKDRFELLKRDAKIAFLLQNQTADNAQSQFDEKIRQLDEQFAFIQRCNKGDRFLQQEDLDKIEEIANQYYLIENQKKPLLNQDEVINLSIRAGTLNTQEREKIMDHARVSLEILNTLPFPKKYKRLINIAGNHHEKLDGSGYPRGLTDKEIGFEDRILILSDLYEALSSKDRPYKEPNRLSQIFKILTSMANDGHIDKKLLRFFYESGTYKIFNQYLDPNQLDEITFELND